VLPRPIAGRSAYRPRTAVTGVVALGVAGVVFVKLLVGVVDRSSLTLRPTTKSLRMILGTIAWCRPGRAHIDVNLLQMVDQDHRRIAIGRDIARRYRNRDALVRTVAELLHDRSRLGAVLCHVGVIAGSVLSTSGGMLQTLPGPAAWSRQCRPALGDDVDKAYGPGSAPSLAVNRGCRTAASPD